MRIGLSPMSMYRSLVVVPGRSGRLGLSGALTAALLALTPALATGGVTAAEKVASSSGSSPDRVAPDQGVKAPNEGAAAPLGVRETSGRASYRASIEAWRKDQEAELRADDGWLTVAGLFWLREGANRFGTDPGNEIVLPAGSAPGRAGVLDFHDGITTVTIEGGVQATSDGKAVTTMKLRPDSPGPPDVLSLNALTMGVIKRGERYGIRLKDRNRAERRTFHGMDWFPVNEAYRVTATFVPYDPPRKIAITNVLGQTESMPCPGYVSFMLGEKELRLDPAGDGDAEGLFFVIRDKTSGKDTYGGGRFLNGEKTKYGRVLLDFNKAYSPPCAFTPYATCPLPPKQNDLPIRIEAGERSRRHD